MRSLHAPGGDIVSLAKGEFRKMDAFVTHPHAVHRREDMITRSGRTDTPPKDRRIDANIGRLGRKLAAFDRTEIIRTVRGKDYLLVADVTDRDRPDRQRCAGGLGAKDVAAGA